MLLCADCEGAEILSDEGHVHGRTLFLPHGQLGQAMTFSTLDEWSFFFFFFFCHYANSGFVAVWISL